MRHLDVENKIKVHENQWPWGKSVTIISHNGDAVVKYSISNNEPGCAYISDLSVVPEVRSQGYATEILRLCLDMIHRDGIDNIKLFAVKDSIAFDMYSKLGFKYYGEREGDGFVPMYHSIN